MSLDPQIEALMKQMQENPAPKLWELPLDQARGLYLAMSQMLDAQGVPIGRTEDRKIPGPAGDIALRVYSPVAGGGGALPALVFYHGGGMVIGNLDTHDALCRQLANEATCRVIAVDYRLAPETKFPGAVEDAFAAVKWVEANASELGIDPNRIAVGGDSAGGNLSAVVSILARDAGAPKIVFQLLIYPWTDGDPGTASRDEFAKGYFLEKETMNWFANQYVNSPEEYSDYRMSPLRAPSHANLPKTLLITAGYDPLKDEGRLYADKLKAAGVSVTYKDYPGQVHGFFNMTGASDEARLAVKEAGSALRAALV